MSKHLKILFMLAAGALVALALTAGLASGKAGHGRHAQREAGRAAAAADPSTVFSVLAAPRSSADDVDAAMHPSDLPGASTAHRLPAPAGTAMWLSSDGGLVCLTIKAFNGGGQTCETISWAASHGIAMTLTDPTDGTHVVVGGVVPNGATGVALDTDAKTGLRPTLTNHSFAVESHSPTNAWHFTTPAGKELNLPLASSAG